MTTAHLPECKAGYPPLQGQGGTGPAYVYPCICPQLRACEQRVREDEHIRTLDYVQTGNTVMNVFGTYYGQGFAAGVQAALKVVEPWLENHSPIDDLMNTIGAMRNPPSLPPTTGRALKY